MYTLDLNITYPKENNYQVIIGKNLIEKISELFDFSNYSKVAIITDTNLKRHLQTLENNLSIKPTVIELKPGEAHKTIKTVEQIWNNLSDAEFDRKSLIINLGGGVITDIGGFAASTYMRGMNFINIPTTLLSQVDASIGGKTGIDFADIKNLIGTFQQPKLVVIDIKTLETLPASEYNAGFGEIIKHGLIQNAEYFKFVTSKKPNDFSQTELVEIISKSCEIKKAIIESDVNEKGARKLLNFGHTIGHAIESLSLNSDKPLLHGEAISIGMIAEAKISQLLGNITESDIEHLRLCLINADLPISTIIDTSNIFEKINKDKKNDSGYIKWTLLKKIGNAEYDIDVDDKLIRKAIEYIL